MHRPRSKAIAVGTSVAVLAVVGSVPATADPSDTGPLVTADIVRWLAWPPHAGW
jgi:hypothetical protein